MLHTVKLLNKKNYLFSLSQLLQLLLAFNSSYHGGCKRRTLGRLIHTASDVGSSNNRILKQPFFDILATSTKRHYKLNIKFTHYYASIRKINENIRTLLYLTKVFFKPVLESFAFRNLGAIK